MGKRKRGRQRKNWKLTGTDTSRPSDPATRSRGHTTLTRTDCEMQPYDRPGQGMKVKVIHMLCILVLNNYCN